MSGNDIHIEAIDPDYRVRANALIEREWMSTLIASRGKLTDTSVIPGFAAVLDGGIAGLISYDITGDECEIIVLESFITGRGIGGMLVRAVEAEARRQNARRLWLITTNDNARAMRFYERAGFTLKCVHYNALDEARKLKPSIPLTGIDGIPLMHEYEYEMILRA